MLDGSQGFDRRWALRSLDGNILRVRLERGCSSEWIGVECLEYALDHDQAAFLMSGFQDDKGMDGLAGLFHRSHDEFLAHINQDNQILIDQQLMDAEDVKPGLLDRLGAFQDPANWDQKNFLRFCNFDFRAIQQLIPRQDPTEKLFVFVSKKMCRRMALQQLRRLTSTKYGHDLKEENEVIAEIDTMYKNTEKLSLNSWTDHLNALVIYDVNLETNQFVDPEMQHVKVSDFQREQEQATSQSLISLLK